MRWHVTHEVGNPHVFFDAIPFRSVAITDSYFDSEPAAFTDAIEDEESDRVPIPFSYSVANNNA